jgi:transcriptional regulator with XRE-family HTH domain
MNIYGTIKEIAAHKGLTIKELEKRAGVANGTVGSWRQSSPTVSSLEKISSALNVNITRLLK